MLKNIVFMGTPNFSVPTLKSLINSSYKVKCVYTQPPKKSFRGQKINPSEVFNFSKQNNLNIRTPETLDTKEEFEYFKTLSPYIVIVVAYGKLIPKKYLNIPQKGFINIHASLLPKWRGAAPIQRSIMNLDKETGISIMKIQEKLDSGPFMKQIKVKIDNQTNSKALSNKLSMLGAQNIIECIDLIQNNKAKFIEQEEKKVTYATKINKKEAKIDWRKSAKEILSKINALNPSPGAWFEYNSTRYKIWRAEIKEHNGLPGEVLDNNLVISCKDQSIKILEIQKEGKNKMLLDDFLKGSKIPKGSKIQ